MRHTRIGVHVWPTRQREITRSLTLRLDGKRSHRSRERRTIIGTEHNLNLWEREGDSELHALQGIVSRGHEPFHLLRLSHTRNEGLLGL